MANIITSSVVNTKNKQIAITGAFSALIILMGIPGLHLGYIQLNPTVSLTIMHIPVVLAAILAGLPGGLVTGTIFGLSSLINAASNPSGVLDPLFVNPLCSVLPRMMFGTATWILFKLLDFIPKMPKTLSASFTAFVASLFHTVCVIGSLYLFMGAKTSQAMNGIGFLTLMGMLLPNACLEALVAVIVSSAVVGTIFISSKKQAKIFSEEE